MDPEAGTPAQTPKPRLWKFRAGLRGPFRGLSFILYNPQLWPWAAVPVAIALALIVGLSSLSVTYMPKLVELITGHGSAWWQVWGVIALQVIAAGSGILLSIVIGFGLSQPLSGFALDRLVRAMERELGAIEHPNVPWWRELARSAAAAFWTLAPTIPILIVLFIIDLFVPFSWIVTFPLKLIVTGLAVTWDLLDYPFSVRGYRLGLRADWMKHNFGAALGFGLALALLFLIPCMQLLLLPSGAVGATWLIHHIDKQEGNTRLPSAPPAA